jgi:hypothetical protein
MEKLRFSITIRHLNNLELFLGQAQSLKKLKQSFKNKKEMSYFTNAAKKITGEKS